MTTRFNEAILIAALRAVLPYAESRLEDIMDDGSAPEGDKAAADFNFAVQALAIALGRNEADWRNWLGRDRSSQHRYTATYERDIDGIIRENAEVRVHYRHIPIPECGGECALLLNTSVQVKVGGGTWEAVEGPILEWASGFTDQVEEDMIVKARAEREADHADA